MEVVKEMCSRMQLMPTMIEVIDRDHFLSHFPHMASDVSMDISSRPNDFVVIVLVEGKVSFNLGPKLSRRPWWRFW